MKWLRWIFVCHLGRDCADVHLIGNERLPPGLVAVVEYTCDGCGRTYTSTMTEWDAERATRPLGNVDVIRKEKR